MRSHSANKLSFLVPGTLVCLLTVYAGISLINDMRERSMSREPVGDIVVLQPDMRMRATVLEAETKEEIETVEVKKNTPEPVSLREYGSYIEVINSCGAHFEGDCVNARSGPSTSSPSLLKLRDGIVLKTDGIVENGGTRWHRVIFDEWVRYPDRLNAPLYVAEEFGEVKSIEAPSELSTTTATTSKRIVIDRSDQHLTAYNPDGTIFMEETISTGLDATPTPRGIFTIFRKTPSRYMQGPLPGISSDYYDLPGVPWNLYFTEQGGAIHGAYWHDKFGRKWSHGCVNLPPDQAEQLYYWADLGTAVVIRD